MTERKLLGFGHSHLNAIVKAYNQGKRHGDFSEVSLHFTNLSTDKFQPNFEHVGLNADVKNDETLLERISARIRGRKAEHDFQAAGRVSVLTEDLEKRMAHILKREAPDVLLLICMGNEYNSMGMLRHPRRFDFDMPGSGIPVDPEAELIPFSLMKAQVQFMADRNALLFWRFFNERTPDLPTFVVPPPPPNPSEDHILSYPGAFADRAKEYGISPVGLRRKVWMLYCDVLRETIAGSSSRFFELPDIVFSRGCLAQQFWQSDPTHANEIYGRVILDGLLDAAFPDERKVNDVQSAV